MAAPILIPEHPLSSSELDAFRGQPFDAMIKFAVDVNRGIVALGGEMHADAEAILLNSGSRQEDVWGGNLHPWDMPATLEFTSLINIRPSSGNRSLVIERADVRSLVTDIVHKWIQLQW